MHIVVRQTTSADWKTLRDINYTSGVANAPFDAYLDVNWVYTAHGDEYFQNAAGEKGYRSFIAEADGTPVGYIVLADKQFPYRKVRMLEVDSVAVLPDFWSNGVGQTLINAAKQFAKKNGHRTVYVNSYIGNDRAVSFYTKQGFVPIGISLEFTL